MVHKVYSKREISGQTRVVFLITAAAASLLGACSADISRFNFNDKQTTTGALPDTTPSEPVHGTRSGLGRTTQQNSFDTVERDDLSTPARSRYDTPSRYDTSRVTKPTVPSGRSGADPQVPPVAYDPPRKPQVINPSARQEVVEPAATGQTIFVRRGDTLYGLSRRHGTTVTALMTANNLTSSALKPGQKLYLPIGARSDGAGRDVAPQRSAVVVSENAPAHWTDSYTIQRGDSLYRLSRRYNVKITDLKRYNGINNPRALKPGMVLKVPGPGGVNGTIAAAAPTTRVPTRKVQSRPIAGSPTILNSTRPSLGPARETQVAAAKPTTTTDAAARHSGQSMTVSPNRGTRNTVAGTTKLRWPVRGRIVSGFGKRNDGTHNDGINVAVPLGTNIHAAEGGMVAYAGDELKGYGNLVLIRHDNGWVTAYAHAEKLLVKRGDRIRRGDVIAKAGKTGEVAQPQVHFEVRQGQKPVDPIPFMDRL